MTIFTAVVELYVSGAWLGITKIDEATKVLAANGITITRGRSDQQGRVAPTEVRFSYLDNNALLDGDNPASPYYRLVGLGTPLRVTVDSEVRAVVEVVSWEPSWDDTARVVTVAVVGAGILRRLEDGRKPLKSPAYRALTGMVNDNERVAYWPLEEESDATTVTSPYGTGSVTTQGTMSFGAEDSMSSARLATFGSVDASMFFTLPTWTNTLGQHFVGAVMKFPAGGLLDLAILYHLYFTGGDIDQMSLLYQTGDILSLLAYAGGALVDTLAIADWTSYISEQEAFVIVTTHQNGANVDVRVRATNSVAWLASSSDTMAARTLGRLYKVVVGTGAGVEGLAFGQLIVGNNKDSFGNFIDDLDTATPVVTGARGYLAEHAAARILRLADEEDLPITVAGASADSERLAIQGIQTATEMIYEAADTDMGILYETRDALELTYRTRADLYNQIPTATLSYGHLTRGFRPASDDLKVTNSVTAQRDGGGTAYYAIPDGDPFHWTTQEPPDGARLRDSEATPAVATDSQLLGQAGWLAHVASWREKRFRQVNYELAHPAFTADDRAAVRALDLGDVIAQGTDGSPPYVPYDEIRLTVQGYTETVFRHLHTFAFSTTPADLYEVDVTDMTGSTLAAPITSVGTTVKIESGVGPTWSNTDEPYYIQVGGQPMTVTTMVTDTAAFIAAGTLATSASGGDTTPGLPAGMTPDVGHLMLAWVTVRNSGVGTVDEHGTWDTLVDIPGANVKLFAKYYETGDAAPTFGYTGEVANAVSMARIFAFSGLSKSFASGTKPVPAAATQLNSSAQNIAYPAMTVNRTGSVGLIFAWKQDDWTSVAPPSGYTEISDDPTTSGDDAGIAAYYKLSESSAAAGSLVVTGGASAISRAVVLALRPLKTATVTRGIASTATSAAVGAEVHVWRPGVTGL